MSGFAGHCVIVTGGSRGTGAGIARRFAAAGADVLVCARHAPQAGVGHFVEADVRDPAQVRRLVATAVERFGRLDVVVNNAGGAPYADAADASPRFHAKVIELNLVAPLHVAQAANAVMRTQPDVADACVYFASPLAAYVTGAALTVPGGGERPAYLAAATRTAYAPEN